MGIDAIPDLILKAWKVAEENLRPSVRRAKRVAEIETEMREAIADGDVERLRTLSAEHRGLLNDARRTG